MKNIKISQSLIIIISLCAYAILVGYIRDGIIDVKYKFYFNIASTSILAFAVLIRLYLKEKSGNKPNYKIYFYSTFFIFLFVSIALLLRK